MCKKIRRQAIRILSVMVLTIFMAVGACQTVFAAGSAETVKFGNLTCKSSVSAESTARNDSATASLSKKGAEVIYSLKDCIDLSSCTAVSVSAKSIGGSVKFRLYDSNGKTIAESPAYKGQISYSFPVSSKSIAASVGIISCSNSSTTVNAASVTFTGGVKVKAPAKEESKPAPVKETKPAAEAAKPTETAKPAAETAAPAAKPAAKPAAAKPASSEPSLLNTQGKIFGKSGVAVNSWVVGDMSLLPEILKEYNSITFENETKPDSVLGWSPTTLTIEEAKAQGYIIPAGYTEKVVPALNLGTLDDVMKICSENGLQLRVHTMIWHSQTPDWFFRSDYKKIGLYVNKDIMDKRMEYFVTNYVAHVCQSEYADVVYAWDVCNEYLHANKSGWSSIYGANLGTEPEFVKKAFGFAYDTLKKYNKQSTVDLYYNDYNCYEKVDDIISLINYINKDRKVCAGIGMQMHLDTDYPPVSSIENAITKFSNAGFKIQITEMDVTCDSEDDQDEYVRKLFTSLVKLQKSGKKIDGITWWGVGDNVSWRKKQTPLLFSEMGKPKKAYYSVLEICK